MMKFIENLIGVISYDRLRTTLSEQILELEIARNKINKDTIVYLSNINPLKDGQKIQDYLINTNKQLTGLYEKETFLREFVDRLK